MSGQPVLSLPPPQALHSPDPGGADQMAIISVKPPVSPIAQQQTPVTPQPSAMSPTDTQPVAGVQTSSLVYPPALAKHEAVVADRDLFFDTLNKFHSALGTRFMIPTIGGKELDLHMLYVEVSSRGGLSEVIRDRKWKEVTTAFNFPPTTTSASYVLRKYYISLIHHYEQVYYFGVQGQLVPPPAAPVLAPSPVRQPADNGFSHMGVEEGKPVMNRKRRRRVTVDPVHLYGVNPGTFVGHMVTGVIDGKCEHGYLVTVVVGTEKLKGVLYHTPAGSSSAQFASVPGLITNAGFNFAPEFRQRRRRRRKDEMPKRDPNAPKPNRSGYNFFFQEQHMKLKALYPDKDKEISRMIGELWNKLTEDEKAVYQQRGVEDKERYKREMAEYQERLKAQACGEGSAICMPKVAMQPEEDSQQDKADVQNSGIPAARMVDIGMDVPEPQKTNGGVDDVNVSSEQVAKHEEIVTLVAVN